MVYVRGLVDFVLLEPPGHSAGSWSVGSAAGEKAPIQFKECVAQQRTLCRIDGRNVVPDAVSKCHDVSPSDVDVAVVKTRSIA
jgi:hypothetical protein